MRDQGTCESGVEGTESGREGCSMMNDASRSGESLED